MHQVDVTPKVWLHLLHIREGHPCSCAQDWSAGEAMALQLYAPVARRDKGDMILAQIGQSLDGRVATVSGDAKDVSGPDGLAHLHRLRALVDAVVIGVKTALHDTPQLTVRLCQGANPARVVIDPSGRLPDNAPMLRDDGARRIVIQGVTRPRQKGVEVIQMKCSAGVIDPHAIRDALKADGIGNLLVEGGSITISKFLEANLLSRMHVAVAPLLIGDGPQGLTVPNPPQQLSQAVRPDTRAFSLGSDVLFDCAISSREGV
ncbi:RibD family protein [Thalassococcus sp. S3]|uniref:RibD family protein n=1 Tax=Thalassococcus sp. S3 TaxID=2017482 RepID=UPI001023FEB1|nr:RibD family protein [Thalassococcus sp. S3]QBF30544.1 riboflavin deaminase [Thalassococcus sp. S3]